MKKISKEYTLSLKSTINVFIIVLILGGIIGFIWETLFYRIDLGYFVKRGSTYGPIIPIYAYGAGLILLLTYRYKDNPMLIFFINTLLLGTLEYITGWALYEFAGKRLWDYNTEIWNWGNLSGYVCARSILCFGFAGIILIYLILPLIIRIVKKVPEKLLSIICYLLLGLFLIDEFTYMFLN